MHKLRLKTWSEDKSLIKNELYGVYTPKIIRFVERQKTGENDIVNLHFDLQECEYGIFAHEFRNVYYNKNAVKTADILSIIIDEDKKQICSTIVDVKHNISSFSDNLLKEGALVTAIKDVRDFTNQLQDEAIHKEGILGAFRINGFVECERFGIATTNFDVEKFECVAIKLEELFGAVEQDGEPTELILLSLMKNLAPYRSELEKIKAFSKSKVLINGNEYDLDVYTLQQISDINYEGDIHITSCKQ